MANHREKWDICLLTENRYLQRRPDDPYISNIFLEDDLLEEALNRDGLSCIRASWEDASFDWSAVRFVLFRTPWNYFERFPQFKQWLESAVAQTRFLNPEILIWWNLDKAYLFELAGKGLPVLPGFYFSAGTCGDLQSLIRHTGWSELVMKPAVSGTARHTYRMHASGPDKIESRFAELLAEESMLLQEFQVSVPDEGEVSLVMFGGEFSHAVLKKAAPGDFRVQDDFGGSLHDYLPDDAEIRLAQTALKMCPLPPLYARVDLIRSRNYAPMVTELELIEPELWFRRNPAAAGRLASLIRIVADEA
jgi:hypothetical protein